MDKLQEIKKLVQHGRDTFIGYVTHHEHKGHIEKAKSNKEHAYNLQLALTIIDELIEESTWQPIKTAPKDGREFIVAQENGYIWYRVQWCDHLQSWVHDGDDDIWRIKAIYWKPLPQPPKKRNR